MKKLFLILGFVLAFAFVQSQDVTMYSGGDQLYYQYTTDVTLTNTTAVWYLIKTDVDWPTTQHALIDVDSVSGNHTAVTLTLLGRNFDDAAWTAISSTIVSQGVDESVDLTLTNTTETRWRQYKVNLVGTGTGVSTINKLEFLLLKPD